MTEHNLPVPDDMPWLNLSQEEVNDLRKSKKELTEYGKQKLKELNENYIPDDDVIEEMIGQKLTDEEKQIHKTLREQEKIRALAKEGILKYDDALRKLTE